MRNLIDIVNSHILNEARQQPLNEFSNDGAGLDLNAVVSYLTYYIGQPLYRVGGPTRVYDVDGGGYGAVYVIGQGNTAVGISWPNRSSGVRSIYVWEKFSLLRAPDYCFSIPNIDFEMVAPTIARLIVHPKLGKTAIEEGYSDKRSLTEARRTSEGEFVQMIRAWASKHNKDISKISYTPDMIDVARENDVQVPGDVRTNKKWRTNRPGLYNFSENGASATDGDAQKAHDAMKNLLGADIAPGYVPAEDEEPDEDFNTALNLAKLKQLRRMVSNNKIFVTGRKNGRFFKFPSELFDQVLSMVERMLARELEDQDPDREGKTSMEVQYEDLIEKVRHIASGKSTFIKSLLITGAPSSGKSFTVMNVIKNELGLKDGRDFVYKKGSVTIPAMFRILIEQCNGGMAIFDDCDSVLTDQDGLNMLKGALDTDKVREVSNDKIRGIVNTAVMTEEERDEYVSLLSEILRGKSPTIADAEYFRKYVPLRALKQTKAENERDAEIERAQKSGDYTARAVDSDEDDTTGATATDGEEDGTGEYLDYVGLSNRQARIIEYVKINLPNKIDFKGRIIFISNMSEEEFASQGKGSGAAILSRAFYTNLSFSSGEMLDFIDKIQDKIKIETLTSEEKAETIQYIRERYSIGGVKGDINFRFIMIAFEYRAMGKAGGNWKRQINSL